MCAYSCFFMRTETDSIVDDFVIIAQKLANKHIFSPCVTHRLQLPPEIYKRPEDTLLLSRFL